VETGGAAATVSGIVLVSIVVGAVVASGTVLGAIVVLGIVVGEIVTATVGADPTGTRGEEVEPAGAVPAVTVFSVDTFDATRLLTATTPTPTSRPATAKMNNALRTTLHPSAESDGTSSSSGKSIAAGIWDTCNVSGA
jgi:hypothetical protein